MPQLFLQLASWCLFATTVVNPCKSAAEASPEDYYYFRSISLQRSNFMALNPYYEQVMEDQLADRRTMFLWKFRFDGEGLQTADNINSQNVGAATGFKVRYKLIENITFEGRADIHLQSGRSQDIFGDLEPDSGIFPRELVLKWVPFDSIFTLRLGQISQKWLNQSLFVGTNLGFPGARQDLELKGERRRWHIGLTTQQLIPTSTTLATRVGEREPTPTLFTETLQGRFSFTEFSFLKLSLTHFRYQDLPRIVAFESFIYGNTVTNTDINNARFIYGFEGLMPQVEFQQAVTQDISFVLQWDIIKNNQAPAELGEAQSLRFGTVYDAGQWLTGLSYKNYFIESDAVPAAYNSHRLGHNNRLGHAFEMTFESKEWGVNFLASYVKADLLNPTTARIDGLQQDNQQTFYLAVETMYDFI